MSSEALYGISALMSFVAFGIITKLFIWARLRGMRREDAILPLVVPHMFRFIGLSFIVPGVVSASLSPVFALPAAYGDLGAAILAIVATLALAAHTSWAVPMVWLFNVWGAADFANAIYEGQFRVHIGPGSLGAAFFIPTVIVPALLVTHGLIFWLLLRAKQ